MRDRLEAELVVLAERLRDQSLVGFTASNTTAMRQTMRDLQACMDKSEELFPRLVRA